MRARFAQVVVCQRPVLFVGREPKVGEVIADIRHGVRLIGQMSVERVCFNLRLSKLADIRLRRLLCARLQHGRRENELRRTAKKQADSETSRKQNASSGINEMLHKSHFRFESVLPAW